MSKLFLSTCEKHEGAIVVFNTNSCPCCEETEDLKDSVFSLTVDLEAETDEVNRCEAEISALKISLGEKDEN
jgi:hypothetical protein